MAFTVIQDRIRAVETVGRVLGNIRTIYHQAKELRDARALYIANTDPAFTAAFNAIFDDPNDRAEIGAMIVDLTALAITDWEANHAAVIGSS